LKCFVAAGIGVAVVSSGASAQQASAVIVAPVRVEAVEISRPLVASVDAVTRSVVASEQAGRVASRAFDEGQTVKANQALAVLDTELMKIELDAAKAGVLAAEADLNRSNVALANEQLDYSRQKKLVDENAAPAKELEDATMQRDMAGADVKLKEAEVARRRAEVARLDAVLRKMTVSAPFEGIVARRSVEVGQWLDQGAAVAEIVQLHPLYVTTAVPESLLGQLNDKTSAKIAFDAFPGEQFAGTLHQIMPEADPSSRTVRVRLLVENKDLRLRPGFFGRVTLTSTASAGTIVPKDALVTSAQGTIVYVVRNNKAELMPVKVLSSNGADATVQPLAGPLNAGDLVVTRGNERLYPGADVMPMPAGEGAPGEAPTTAPNEQPK
jgi:RND family efflux transporter MFP subunit